MKPTSDTKLSYIVSPQRDHLVLFFAGALGGGSRVVLDQCRQLIRNSGYFTLIMDLKGVRQYDAVGVGELARFCQEIPGSGTILRACSLDPDLSARLQAQGALEPTAVARDLISAIRALSFKRVAFKAAS